MDVDIKFHSISNIFSDDERNEFIKKVQPYLIDYTEWNKISGIRLEGKQTDSDLYKNKIFSFYYIRFLDALKKTIGCEFEIEKSWINYHDGKRKELCWHLHPGCSHVAVYYLKTNRFFNSGTMFKGIGFIKSKQDSLLLFPSHLEHSVPLYKFGFSRYTLSMNLNIFTK
tara:strand:+ start:293 stop:799 length:507 start_codon:yes stop_codon:yes gene_type:complete